jgi:hypothetical protein
MSIGHVDLKEPKLGYENVAELLDADENVKKIFSLEYSTHADVMQKHVSELLKNVRDHPLDIKSLEVKIAHETIRIRNAIDYCLRFRNDKVAKAKLIELIHRRKGHLRRLMIQDIDKFNWIQEQLRVKFEEDPKWNKKQSKAATRKRIARDAAIAAVKDKVERMRKALDEEKVKFEKYKEAELADIERGLLELGVKDEAMMSLEATLKALGHEDMLPKPKPRISRRRQILERKFALYMPQKKVKDNEILQAHGFLTPEELSHYPDTSR